MPISGFQRYFKLLKNISNPGVYWKRKLVKAEGPLSFVTKPHAIRIDVPSKLFLVFKEIFMSDVYDIDDLVKQLPANPVVVDIGANAGYFDLILLSKIASAKVYAYEPMPSNVGLFSKTIETNKLGNRIDLHQKAVTGQAKSNIDLFVEEDADDSTVIASVFSDFSNSNTKKISVPTVSLTEIIEGNNLKQIDVLKIDCEGSEFDIIYNTPAELVQRAKIIAVEVHDMDKEKANVGYFESYLQSMGYRTTHSQINGFCHALTATKIPTP